MKVHHIEVHPVIVARQKQWAWRAVARNGRKLGWSGEPNKSRAHCISAMEAVTDATNRRILVEILK